MTYEELKNIESIGTPSNSLMVGSIFKAIHTIEYELSDNIKPMAKEQLVSIASKPINGKHIAGMIDSCVDYWKENDNLIK